MPPRSTDDPVSAAPRFYQDVPETAASGRIRCGAPIQRPAQRVRWIAPFK
jgi:hypothetical protein